MFSHNTQTIKRRLYSGHKTDLRLLKGNLSLTGLTLVEILISAAIFIIIIIGIFGVLNAANMSWYVDAGSVELQQQSRLAMDGMVRELRQAKKETGRPITISGAGTTIQFYIPNYASPIIYSLQGNKIAREHPTGTQKVLANDINLLDFCCLGGATCVDCSNSQALQIQLGATKTVKQRVLTFPVSGSFTEQVRLRNE